MELNYYKKGKKKGFNIKAVIKFGILTNGQRDENKE